MCSTWRNYVGKVGHGIVLLSLRRCVIIACLFGTIVTYFYHPLRQTNQIQIVLSGPNDMFINGERQNHGETKESERRRAPNLGISHFLSSSSQSRLLTFSASSCDASDQKEKGGTKNGSLDLKLSVSWTRNPAPLTPGTYITTIRKKLFWASFLLLF